MMYSFQTLVSNSTCAATAWEWLKNMKAIRHKWAWCYVVDTLTLLCFSSARSEGWHSALKEYMFGRQYLLAGPDMTHVLLFKGLT